MKKKTRITRFFSLLLCCLMLVGLLPLGQVAYAGYEDGVECEYCGAWRYDDWLCEHGDHCAAGHGCGDEHHCIGCGECEGACDWCEDCKMCVDCAMELACHCWDCGVCGVESPLCDECGLCYDCGGECSEGTDHLCLQCHLAEDMACPDCGQCYAVADPVKCLNCGGCGLCASEWCDDCWMCIDCAMETHCHCSECGVCGVESPLCDECGKCYDCAGECSEGTSHLCLECHLAEDMACPDCGKCYAVGDEGAKCQKCGACSDCVANYCEDCKLCEDCAIEAGKHCPDCGTCTQDQGCLICHRCYDCGGQCNSGCEDACLQCHYDYDQACPDCGNCFLEGDFAQCPECGLCAECGGGWCDNCEMCLNCAMNNDLHCPGCEACLFDVSAYCDSCRHCEDCADICPECGEKCSECSVLCNNCGVCEDCTDICPVCGDYCSQCSNVCGNCGACENCADICPECENACTECSTICDDCGLCEDCCRVVSEAAGCEHGVCVMSSDWDSHWEAGHAGQEHTHVYPGAYSTDADEHWKACKICGEKADRGAHRDNLTHVPAKEATCSDAGNKEYYICVCGMWFEDETAQTEISDHKSVELPALGHRPDKMQEVMGTAPTCTAPGRWRYGLCPDCGKCYVYIQGRGYVAEITNMDDLIRPALGHDWSAWIETKAATTTEEGEETRTCSRCGEEENRSIAKLGVASYEIIVNYAAGGYAVASAVTAEEGKNITINAVPDIGYVIRHITWVWTGGYEEYITDNPSFVMPAGDVTVDVAFEKATTYTINMAVGANGNAVASAATSEEGKTITITVAPNSGYVVDEILLIPQSGYETDITEAGSFTMPACDVTIDVSFREAAVCTVTFDSNGHGTAPEAQTVEEGETATEPGKPTASGYTFGGWYTDSACKTKYDFSTPITGNISLFAKWTKTYTVTVNPAEHGTVNVSPLSGEAGDEITLTATPDSGWFLGQAWYTPESDPGFRMYIHDGKFTLPADNVTVTVTFAQPHSIIFTDGSGTAHASLFLTDDPITQQLTGNTVFIKPTAVSGKYVTKWTASPDITFESNSARGFFDMPDFDVTLTPVYADQTAVTVDLTGGLTTMDEEIFWALGEINGSPSGLYVHDTPYELDLDGEGTNDIAVTLTGGTTANVEALAGTNLTGTYSVTALNTYKYSPINFKFSDDTPITEYTVTQPADATVTASSGKQSIGSPTFSDLSNVADISLGANHTAFTSGSNSISFTLTGENGVSSDPSIFPQGTDSYDNQNHAYVYIYVSSDSAEIAALRPMTMYVQLDESDLAAAEPGTYTATVNYLFRLYCPDKVDVVKSQTLTLTVEGTTPATYTVTFDANGGTGSMADVTGISGEYTLPANGFTAPEGKQFKAWSVNGSEKAVGDTITVNANTTVTAIWEAIEYNVTVTGGTASVGASTPITKATMGTTVTLTAGAAPSGQMFDKWVVNGVVVADANSATTTFTMPANNVTAQATYKDIPVVTYTVSFDANGGSGTMTPATGVSGDYVLPVCGFTAPNGKQFKAWSVGGNEKAEGETITVTANTTVTAVWETIPAGHTCDIKPVAKVEPSCTEGGKEAYYKCEGCGKFYEDALGAKEITDLAAWGNLDKLGHTESGWKSDKDNHWKECTVAGCGVIIENSKAAHKDDNNDGKCDTCEYNVGTTTTKPEDTNKPSDDVQSPQTGDNSMMWLWVALLFVSGFGVVATTVYGKKKSSAK